MPELPEVETVRRGLAPVLEGRVLARVLARRNDLRFPLPKDFAERLTGRRVEKLTRRAKYILAHLDGGEILIIHLGMSGRFQIEGGELGRFLHNAGSPGKHDHIEFETDRGVRIVFSDHRRFGMMDLFPSDQIGQYRFLAEIGPEPLAESFTGPELAARLKGKKAPIKAALLDQRVVAGVGNIYADESLHLAGIDPRTRCSRLGDEAVDRLARSIRTILARAVASGGSTLRDHRSASGEPGSAQELHAVYGRSGKPCLACGAAIRSIRLGGRTTAWCPGCQRRS